MTQKNSPQPVFDTLKNLNILFTAYEHEACATVEQCDLLEAAHGAPHFKNLFLQTRNSERFFLLVICSNKKFVTANVSKQIPTSRLSFSTPELLNHFLGVTPGAVTPLGLIHYLENKVEVLIDKDLLGKEQLCFHPCVNTGSVKLSGADFFDVFLPAVGKTPQFVEVL